MKKTIKEAQEDLLNELIDGCNAEIKSIIELKKDTTRDTNMLFLNGRIHSCNSFIEVLEAKKGLL